MDQANKPAKPTAAERNEKVRQVLLAAGEPLGPTEIAARINEDWCSWNGMGLGSAVTPALRKIGAKSHKGKWELKSAPADEGEPGCVGEVGAVPPHAMTAARWAALRAEMSGQQQK